MTMDRYGNAFAPGTSSLLLTFIPPETLERLRDRAAFTALLLGAGAQSGDRGASASRG